MLRSLTRHCSLLLALILISACSNSDDPPVSQTKTVAISWDANNESQVNTTGGGYKVYYSQTSGFALTDNGVTEIDVPYVSGSAAPTSTQLQLSSGTYYIKVVAYSAFPAGQTTSEVSTETSIKVPFN